jgi:TetR/AcrR family transcriptional regulator, transcriptional repressor for nem operon
MVHAMPATARSTRSKPARGEARVSLLNAAHKLVRQKGWTATSVDDLCGEACVTKGAFFHHFASKDELGVAAAQHWSEVTGPLFAGASYHQRRDPLDRIFGYLDFRASLADGPLEAITCFAGTTVQEMFATSEPLRAACGASITDHAATLTGYFAAAIAQRRPAVKVTANSLALYTQTVLQGGFVLSKATGDRASLLDAITHLKNYLRLLFKETRQ